MSADQWIGKDLEGLDGNRVRWATRSEGQPAGALSKWLDATQTA
ncbi:hypothetical protein SAMN05444920_1075 [Nonomuraea solani]|uniref:Uncharacterized protein n=1 Tax=Nonomuraea solani TaxID=1144553 RepID=A0A1H6DYU5_9ACTN|nr:hypothetical protein SAMN05444920_1075 [Nonomuraea solani]